MRCARVARGGAAAHERSEDDVAVLRQHTGSVVVHLDDVAAAGSAQPHRDRAPAVALCVLQQVGQDLLHPPAVGDPRRLDAAQCLDDPRIQTPGPALVPGQGEDVHIGQIELAVGAPPPGRLAASEALLLRVLDEGVGIPDGEHDSIFDKFNGEFTSGNNFLQNEIGVAVKMTDRIALALAYAVRHNTDPPAGFRKTDTLTTVNLVYEVK